MNYRPFGKAGFDVSEISFGAWAVGGGWGPQSDDDSVKALQRAIDLGVNFVDTAAGYGNGRSERVIASVVKGRKENVFIATKTPPSPGAWPPSPYCRAEERYSEAYLRSNVEERLKCLGVGCLDLLQLHSWTRAWNRNPTPLLALRKLREEGKLRLIGVSTPEHDQNSVIDLIRGGWVDSVQVIFNVFEQEPAAELLDTAREHGVGIIVRVPFDEGSLTGKFTEKTTFADGDFRHSYFAGDRMARTVRRVEAVRHSLDGTGYTLPQAALKFILAHPAVSTVIPGMRNPDQVNLNCAVSALPPMAPETVAKLQKHNWRRGIWYPGK
jgi:aryl-alcohol dehydrogenase-like predicted oxidoreductase